MNKELIKKYKKEFDHWLNGGKLLSISEDKFSCRHYSSKTSWHEYSDAGQDAPKWVKGICYIINDEYVEFRKALAEGKTLEYNRKAEHKNPQYDDWGHWECGQSFGNLPLTLFRIKPEEPKFKVGDWVKHEDGSIGTVKKLVPLPGNRDVEVYWKLDRKGNIITEYAVGEHKSSKLEPWKPKQGEWCWFWDSENLIPMLKKFTKMHGNRFGHNRLGNRYSSLFCEPYLGQLPTILKEK